MANDDDQRIDTDATAALLSELTGETIKSKTIANWRHKGNVFSPGDWRWYGRTATTTKGVVRRVAAERGQEEPARRRNARRTTELTDSTT